MRRLPLSVLWLPWLLSSWDIPVAASQQVFHLCGRLVQIRSLVVELSFQDVAVEMSCYFPCHSFEGLFLFNVPTDHVECIASLLLIFKISASLLKLLHLIFFPKINLPFKNIYLFEMQNSRVRGRDKEVLHPLVHSSNDCNSQGWPEQRRSQELCPGFLCRWQGPKYLFHLLLPLQAHSELDQKWNSWYVNQRSDMGCQHGRRGLHRQRHSGDPFLV